MFTIVALAATLASPLAQAVDDCQPLNWLDISAEDASIMASVRPQRAIANPTVVAKAQGKIILYSVPDYFGRMSDEDLSQIRSVQPQGEKIVLCPRPNTRQN
jgi:hypothetical protein